ncbi:MAG: molybdenum cofactor guanylyltransferase [Candidatus Helarchaeota archaeon]
MEKIAGVILSGGLAKRFQTDDKKWIDKAIVIVDDKPILVRLVEILEKITDEILITVNNEKRKISYVNLLEKYGKTKVKIYLDEVANCKGPLLGILTGMKKIKAKYCLILPCDLPYMKVETLQLLIRNIRYNKISMFLHSDGEIEPLPACIPIKNCLKVAELVCNLGKRRVDDIYRGCSDLVVIPTYRMEEFDRQFKSFVNLNTPNDLKDIKQIKRSSKTKINSLNIETENKIYNRIATINELITDFEPNNLKPILEIISDLEKDKLYYWIATFYEFIAMYIPKYYKQAAENYLKESNFYTAKYIRFLARHAKLDQVWCLKQLRSKV